MVNQKSSNDMRAVVIGGTGATGKELVKHLLDDARFEGVTVLVRRPYFENNPKLKEIIIDFEDLAAFGGHIMGEVAFSCLGTTLKDAGGKDAQWRVDHDYQLEFATLARKNGVGAFVLLSAYGAKANSSIFYNKMKGSLEQQIASLDFPQLTIVQPGGIERPNSTRTGEKLFIPILKAFNAMGLFKAYAPLSTDRLAQGMIAAFFGSKEKINIVTVKEIKEITT